MAADVIQDPHPERKRLGWAVVSGGTISKEKKVACVKALRPAWVLFKENVFGTAC